MLMGGAGVNDFHLRDKYLSREAYSDLMFTARISFQILGEAGIHRIDGSYSAGTIPAGAYDGEIDEDGASLSYSYGQRLGVVPVFGNPLRISLGGSISTWMANWDMRLNDPATGTHTFEKGWYWSHALSMIARADYRPGAGSDLSLLLTLPVVGLVSRPENGHWLSPRNQDVTQNIMVAAEPDGVEYLWNSAPLSVEVQYRHMISASFALTGTYLFTFGWSDNPDESLSMGLYTNQLLLGLSWTISAPG
jgi:hypothetical protein